MMMLEAGVRRRVRLARTVAEAKSTRSRARAALRITRGKALRASATRVLDALSLVLCLANPIGCNAADGSGAARGRLLRDVNC
jgi:hypothetical protein